MWHVTCASSLLVHRSPYIVRLFPCFENQLAIETFLHFLDWVKNTIANKGNVCQLLTFIMLYLSLLAYLDLRLLSVNDEAGKKIPVNKKSSDGGTYL